MGLPMPKPFGGLMTPCSIGAGLTGSTAWLLVTPVVIAGLGQSGLGLLRRGAHDPPLRVERTLWLCQRRFTYFGLALHPLGRL